MRIRQEKKLAAPKIKAIKAPREQRKEKMEKPMKKPKMKGMPF